MGVGGGVPAFGEASRNELFGVQIVGGKEDVLWIAIEQLLGEGCGGAEGGDDFDSAGMFVGGCKGGHNGLQVGCCCDVEFFWSLGACCQGDGM